jgi:hypothetical protein
MQLDPSDPAFPDTLWRFRLRGIAAADGLAAWRAHEAAVAFVASRPDPLAQPMRGFLCEYDPGRMFDPMRGSSL